MQEFSVTVLVTRQEYAAFATAAAKRPGIPLKFWVGVLCLVLGILMYFLSELSATVGLWLFGAVLCLWDGVIAPPLAASLAVKEYDVLYGGRVAQTLVFSADAVRVSIPRAEGVLPLSAVTRVVASKTGVQLDFGRSVSLYIPERSVTPEQLAYLRGLCG